MGAKENLEYIKEELSNEEKFLESMIKAENFYKKYKKAIKIGVVALVLAVAAYLGYEWKVNADLRASNEAFERLMQNPQDKEALETLKAKNEKLYMLYLYKQALSKKDVKALEEIARSGLPVLSDLAEYHAAAIKKEEPKLYSYGLKKSAIMKEMALLDDGYLNMKERKIEVAKERMEGIPQESAAYPFAKLLAHYGLKVR